MAFEVNRVGTVLAVSDFERSLAFYQMIGFRVVREP